MNYIDLSHKMIDKMDVYPGDPEFRLKEITTNDEDYSLFKISGGLHTGTHIDAPYHYIPNGKKVSDLDIKNLVGKASIIKMKNDVDIINKCIKIDDVKIEKQLENIAILNTGWFKHWNNDIYFNENPYISKELAKLLIESEISGIAIDTCSVDKVGQNHIHKMFLKNDIWIVENLTNMDQLTKDKYYSYFIPMNIDAEASYVRSFVEY
ncbi:cyclase family protein [Methanobrevibacter sp. TMH8]|uniref:cyclase family protein n=1 Tax=Methanobrevibacter sp. TMH8 TaxID=2848611 RepID=UPI001CCAB5F7|nr:cyclase family protein [Methanobrevibacter sp. TMH8]MBZ9571550.1 cyclase family protein [Methanobrevibacter sp. TMH8]